MTSLVSASLKLERAAQHLRALQESVTGYIASKPFVFEWAAPDVPQARAVVMRHKPGIPPIDSCLVGDWVHNLRCALDHAVWETSVLCGAPSSNKRLAFPGFGKFDGDVLKWLPESVQQACERLHANIDIQELLFADNVDKHRMVQVVFVQPIAFFEDPPGIHIEYTNEEWRDGAIVAKVTVLHGPTPAKPPLRLVASPAIGRSNAIGFVTLDSLWGTVPSLIQAFITTCEENVGSNKFSSAYPTDAALGI